MGFELYEIFSFNNEEKRENKDDETFSVVVTTSNWLVLGNFEFLLEEEWDLLLHSFWVINQVFTLIYYVQVVTRVRWKNSIDELCSIEYIEGGYNILSKKRGGI